MTMELSLKSFRQREGFSQEQLAEAFGYGQGTMSKVESERSNVSWAKLKAAADTLGVSPRDFFTFPDDPPPSAQPLSLGRNPRRWVVQANGGASFADGDRPVIAISLEGDDAVEERFLMPETVARVLRARLDRGLGEIEEHEARLSSSHPSSA